MSVTVESVQNTMTGGGTIAAAIIRQAINDALFYLTDYEISDTNPKFDILRRLYACHLLYVNGFGRRESSKSVGDLSISYETPTFEQREMSSPYLVRFQTLLAQNNTVLSI